MLSRRLVSILLCFIVFLGCAASATAADAADKRVAIVISQRIKPYMEAFDGFQNEISTASGNTIKPRVYYLDKYTGFSRDRLAESIARERFDLLVAIGPSATRFVWNHFQGPDTQKLYTMVLRPAGLTFQDPESCGIALDIPPPIQLKALSCFVSSASRVGVLYNPEYNEAFMNQLVSEAEAFGMKVVPMAVSSTKEITSVLQNNWKKIDTLLFIPDPTVIYESLVIHLIKQALLRRVVSVGFNRFFHENGAALSFILDYNQTGRKTGRQALAILSGTVCTSRILPEFTVRINPKILEYVGLKTEPGKCPEFEVTQ